MNPTTQTRVCCSMLARSQRGCQLCAFPYSSRDRDFSSFKICSELWPLHNYFCPPRPLFFSSANFQNHFRGKPPLVTGTQRENSSVPIKRLQRQGFSSFSAELTSNPFSSSYQMFRWAEIPLLCLKLTTALMQVFACPNSLLKGLTAWQQCILQGRGAKLSSADHPVVRDTAFYPLLCTGADALKSQWRRKQGRIFNRCFLSL